jgi:hypothetical protein
VSARETPEEMSERLDREIEAAAETDGAIPPEAAREMRLGYIERQRRREDAAWLAWWGRQRP